MKKLLQAFVLALAALISASSLHAASPEQEKAFVDSYKKAFEAKDEKILLGFLYTQGADPQVLEFFKMMMTGEAGSKISTIELIAISPEDLKKLDEPQPLPGGGNGKFNVKPYKKLKITITTEDANGKSSSSSEAFVAEKDGKLVIPVPAPVK